MFAGKKAKVSFNEVLFVLPVYFIKFGYMTGIFLYTPITNFVRYIILDISNSVTWSFPEFVPFCPRLYYFSTYKDFNTLALA